MKVVITENQFNRVILNEQYDKPYMHSQKYVKDKAQSYHEKTGFGISSLILGQPSPNDKIESAALALTKGLGIIDIKITGGFDNTLKKIKDYITQHGGVKGSGLDYLRISTHGTGCGPFDLSNIEYPSVDNDNTQGISFLKSLSQYLKPTTKVFHNGCQNGKNPDWVSAFAYYLGVNKATAATGNYYPGRFWDHLPEGSYVTCNGFIPEGIEEHENKFWNRKVVSKFVDKLDITQFETGSHIDDYIWNKAGFLLSEDDVKLLNILVKRLGTERESDIKQIKYSIKKMMNQQSKINVEKRTKQLGCKYTADNPIHYTFW